MGLRTQQPSVRQAPAGRRGRLALNAQPRARPDDRNSSRPARLRRAPRGTPDSGAACPTLAADAAGDQPRRPRVGSPRRSRAGDGDRAAQRRQAGRRAARAALPRLARPARGPGEPPPRGAVAAEALAQFAPGRRGVQAPAHPRSRWRSRCPAAARRSVCRTLHPGDRQDCRTRCTIAPPSRRPPENALSFCPLPSSPRMPPRPACCGSQICV